MKTIKFKFLLLLLTSVFLLSGCDESSEWFEAELQNTTCNSSLTTVVTYNDVEGTVVSIPGVSDHAVYIQVDDPDSAQETDYVAPCNLPEQHRVENLRIMFSGHLKAVSMEFQDPGNEILVIA